MRVTSGPHLMKFFKNYRFFTFLKNYFDLLKLEKISHFFIVSGDIVQQWSDGWS